MGSIPTEGTKGVIQFRLRALSSVGRAIRLHRKGRGFESLSAHMDKNPHCIGVILDGNRRWAVREGLPKLEGHRRGYERMIDCTRWVRDRGIKHLVAYAFSTENWNRDPAEVAYLMDLFRALAGEDLRELAKEGVKVRFIGALERLAPDLQELIREVESQSMNNEAVTLWVCLSYGGRAEITAAAAAVTEAGEPITEEALRSHLWSADMPDPDLIIRTGGAQRLSNFLLWQAAYSELFFIDPFWPDFSEVLLDGILAEYAERERRMGK